MERNKHFQKLSFIVIVSFLIFIGIIAFSASFFSIEAFRRIFYILACFLLVIVLIFLLGFIGVQKMLSSMGSKDSSKEKGDLSSERKGVIISKSEGVITGKGEDTFSKEREGAITSKGKGTFTTRLALRVFMPILMSISGFFNYSKDDIRQVYIRANNEYILSLGKKVRPENLLVILPHCIQSSKCMYRIRDGLKDCRQCMACNIGSIADMVNRYGVRAELATGGTSARKMILDQKPEFVIAVACERDLSSGLMDVKGLPVYGILNQRPNGPCKDTFVDIAELEKMILHFTGQEEILSQ